MFSVLTRLFRRTPPPLDPRLWEAAETPLLPALGHLSQAEHLALREMALAFLARKVFAGAHGFEPDDRVRLAIALQACLPVLKLGLEAYAGWSGIVVYPHDFVIPRQTMDEDGLVHEYDEEALGESWDGGPVLLTWFDATEDYDGAQVVIHEFAHKLDMLGGEADGMPPLHAGMNRQRWQEDFAAAYADFGARVDAGEETAIDPYAAEHPAEFFAVASEVFFMQPALLAHEYPAIYAQLASFYRQNPLLRPAGENHEN